MGVFLSAPPSCELCEWHPRAHAKHHKPETPEGTRNWRMYHICSPLDRCSYLSGRKAGRGNPDGFSFQHFFWEVMMRWYLVSQDNDRRGAGHEPHICICPFPHPKFNVSFSSTSPPPPPSRQPSTDFLSSSPFCVLSLPLSSLPVRRSFLDGHQFFFRITVSLLTNTNGHRLPNTTKQNVPPDRRTL
jgi:hypothetical protein